MADRDGARALTEDPAPDSASGACRDPGLARAVHDLLYGPGAGGPRSDADLRELERRLGDGTYAEALELLSGLRFGAAEAKQHWQAVVARRDSMQARLGKPVDLRVALVSHFVEVERESAGIIGLKLLELRSGDGAGRVRPRGGDRRPDRRVPARLDGKLRVLADEDHSLITINLGENGVLFIAGRRLSPGELVEVDLTLSPPCGPVSFCGRVARAREIGGGKFEAALVITGIHEVDRRILARYLADSSSSAGTAARAS